MVTIDVLLPGFESYLSDMESNLRMDKEEFAEYQRDPGPYITDMLLDFGTFPEGDPVTVAMLAVEAWLHPHKR